MLGLYSIGDDSNGSFPLLGLLGGDPFWPLDFLAALVEDEEPKRPGGTESSRGSFRLPFLGTVLLPVTDDEGKRFTFSFVVRTIIIGFILCPWCSHLSLSLALNVHQSVPFALGWFCWRTWK